MHGPPIGSYLIQQIYEKLHFLSAAEDYMHTVIFNFLFAHKYNCVLLSQIKIVCRHLRQLIV